MLPEYFNFGGYVRCVVISITSVDITISAKLCISFPFGIGRCFYVCIHQLPSCFTFESLTLISGNGGEMFIDDLLS